MTDINIKVNVDTSELKKIITDLEKLSIAINNSVCSIKVANKALSDAVNKDILVYEEFHEHKQSESGKMSEIEIKQFK